MQTDKLYPTSSTTTDGIQLTDHLQDISGFADTMADAYLMGYIHADKMPAAFMPVYLSGGVGEMSAIYHPKNTGWGYGILDSTEDQRWATSFARVNNEIIARPAERNKYRLFNAIKMARANTNVEIRIYFTFAFIDDTVYDGDGGTIDFVHAGIEAGSWGSNSTQIISYTFDQFANIIKNDLPLFSVTRTGARGLINGKTYTFAPRPSEFGDSNDPNADHKWVKDSGQGAQAVVLLVGYEISSQMAYANGNGGAASYYLRPFAYPDIDAVGSFPATKAMLFPASLSSVQQNLTWDYDKNTRIFQLVPGNTQTYTIADYNINPGGFNFGTITDQDADFTNTSLNQRDLLSKKSIWMTANRFGTVTGGVISNLYTPIDIYRHALLYHKHTTDGTLTTYSNDTFVTKFNTKNEPSDTIVSGEISDIKLDLQPWQYPEIDITANTFTSKNIPDSSDTGINLIRFGGITPSEFLFGDISIEKIYFGSSLLYQKFVPEQYVRLNPADRFITENASADDYRVYGPLPSGEIIISVRTPRVKNLLPFPYKGFWQENGDGTWGHYTDSPGKDVTIDSSGVVSTGAGSVSLKYSMVLASNMGSADLQPSVIVPVGTYTASIRPGYVSRSTGWHPQLEIWAFRVTDPTYELFNHITDYDGSGYNGRITFTVNEPAIVVMSVFYTSSRNFVVDTLYPQLEAGSMTEFEPVNPATLTTITLPRALEETEYISYADQKIMPTGTPITVPKLKTKIGENVIMIENYPTATNTITLTPATKE